MTYQNPWTYQNKIVDEIPKNYIGYVYLIVNTQNNRKYIGKKNFFFSKTRQVKKKKVRSKVESDWKEYYSSCEELKNDVKKIGEHNFKREILRLCSTKAEMSYYEAKFQFENDVLLSNEWYNFWLSVRVRKAHLTNNKKTVS